MQGKLSEVSNPNISDAGSKNVTENKKKSRKPAVIAVASAVAVLAGGGWFVWKTYANHELAEARQACVEASESYRKAADSYSGLVDGDAATASQITVKQVADAKTVDALAEALKVNEPDVVACVADSKADYESKTSLIEKKHRLVRETREELGKRGQGRERFETGEDRFRCGTVVEGFGRQGRRCGDARRTVQGSQGQGCGQDRGRVEEGQRLGDGEDEGGRGGAAQGRGGGRRAGRRTGPDADAAVVFGAATVVHALVFRRFDIEWRRFQQRAGLRSKQRRSRMHDRLPSALKRWIDSPLI